MQERSYSLDFLKFVCAIGIVWMHFRENTCPDGLYIGTVLINKETTGVDFLYLVEIFFVLSGFFMYPYIRKIKEGLSFNAYYIPRLIRIIPMLMFCTVFLEILCYLMVCQGNTHGMEVYQPNLFGIITAGLGVEIGWGFRDAGIFRQSWYLDVLLLNYLLFFLAVRASVRMRINEKAIFIFLIVLGTVCVNVESTVPFLQVQNGRGYVAFFVGLLLAERIREGNLALWKRFSIITLFVYLLYHVFGAHYLVFGKTFLISFFVAPSILIIMQTPTAKKMFSWRGWGELGKISFAIYLIHIVLIVAVYDIMDAVGVNIDFAHGSILLAFLMLVLIVASILHYAFEEPVQKVLEKKLFRR